MSEIERVEEQVKFKKLGRSSTRMNNFNRILKVKQSSVYRLSKLNKSVGEQNN